MNKFVRYFTIAAFIAFAFSCKKKTPENIGLPLLPGTDLLNAQYTDTLTLVAHTVKDDSLLMFNPYNKPALQLLGNMNDPIFGITKASIFTQFALSVTNPAFGTNPLLDSAVLSFAYYTNRSYGNLSSSSPQKFDVYELSESLNYDSTYYSNKLKQYYTTQQIGSTTVVPDIKDSVLVGTPPKLPPQLRIKLSKVMFQNFLDNPTYTSTYAGDVNFQNVFKGIYVNSSTIPSTGNGAILALNLTSGYSRLTLYYHHDEDSLLHNYYFGISDADCARYSYFEHNYSSAADISSQLGTHYTIPENYVYVQPMAGVRTKITMPCLMKMFGGNKVAINKAELDLPVEANAFAGADSIFSATAQLVATVVDSVKGPLTMPDYFEGSTYFGGVYDATNKIYKLNIARYIQQILDGKIANTGMYLLANSRSTTVNRIQLFGGTNFNSNKIKLRITYTLVK